MEKLYITIVILALLNSFGMHAQDSLTVYNIDGNVKVQKKASTITLTKGDYFLKKDRLIISEGAFVVFIDKNGSAYKCDSPNIKRYQDVLKAIQKSDSNFIISYMKTAYNYFTNNEKKENVELRVLRGDDFLIRPADSSFVIKTKITFIWKDTDSTTPYYFYLRNLNSEELMKLEISDTLISLYKDNPIFKDSDQFEWAISKYEYPNLRNLSFNQFNTLSRLDYTKKLETFNGLVSDLEALNFKTKEIDSILCSEYGLCEKLK